MNIKPPTPRPISYSINATGDGGHIPTVITFRYDPVAPYQVMLRIIMADHPVVTWIVSREVLCTAAMWHIPAGGGDFIATPRDRDSIRLGFRNEYENGYTGIDVPCLPLRHFLMWSLRVVPSGHESALLDLDGVIARLLGIQIQPDSEDC